jgi:hypothetical protein
MLHEQHFLFFVWPDNLRMKGSDRRSITSAPPVRPYNPFIFKGFIVLYHRICHKIRQNLLQNISAPVFKSSQERGAMFSPFNDTPLRYRLPLIRYLQAGTKTVPPKTEASFIALLKDAVLSVIPSSTAPKFKKEYWQLSIFLAISSIEKQFISKITESIKVLELIFYLN